MDLTADAERSAGGFLSGEDQWPWCAARQPAPGGGAGPQHQLAQPVGDAPMGGKPSQRVRMGWKAQPCENAR